MSRPTIGEGVHHGESKKRACPEEFCCFLFPMQMRFGIVEEEKE